MPDLSTIGGITLPKFNISGEKKIKNTSAMFISGFFGVWNI